MKNRPGLETLEAVFGFLGFDLVPIPKEQALPPEVVAELQPIADRLGMAMPAAIAAAAEIAVRDHRMVARGAFPL